MEMPMWLSTWRIFFWCAASSDWALCRNNTEKGDKWLKLSMDSTKGIYLLFRIKDFFIFLSRFWLCEPLMRPGLRGFWTSVPQLLIPASLPPWHTRSDGCGPGSTQTGNSSIVYHNEACERCTQRSDTVGRKWAKRVAPYLWTPYCHVVVVLITKLRVKWQKHVNKKHLQASKRSPEVQTLFLHSCPASCADPRAAGFIVNIQLRLF